MNELVTIDFHGDTLFALERDDGVYVAVNPICKTLGIAVNKQRERIQNDPVLSEGGTVTVLPSAGGAQETLCLRLDLVNGWLLGIDARRVKAESRERVIEYQRECYRVLFEHFYAKRHGAAAEPQLSVTPEPFDLDPAEHVVLDENGVRLHAIWVDGEAYLAMRPICEALGIAWVPQVEAMGRHRILMWGYRVLAVPTPAGRQIVPVVEIGHLQGWLLSIDEALVSGTAKDRLLYYQRSLSNTFIGLVLSQTRRAMMAEHASELAQRDDVKLKKVAIARSAFGEAAAREMWLQLGLETSPSMLRSDPRVIVPLRSPRRD